MVFYQMAVSSTAVVGTVRSVGQMQLELNAATTAFANDVRIARSANAPACYGGPYPQDPNDTGTPPVGPATFAIQVPRLVGTAYSQNPAEFDCIIYDYDDVPDRVLRRVVVVNGGNRQSGTTVLARNITLAAFNHPSSRCTQAQIGGGTCPALQAGLATLRLEAIPPNGVQLRVDSIATWRN